MPIEANYSDLKKLLQKDHDSRFLSLQQSIGRLGSDLDRALQEIKDGEWNGTKIKDATKIPSYLQIELQRILDAGVVLTGVAIKNKGWYKLNIAFNDRAQYGSEVDLQDVGKHLEGMINRWMRFVEENPEWSPGLPLAINHPARQQSGITVLLRDTLRQTDSGHDSIAFRKNADLNVVVATTGPSSKASM